MKRWVCLLLVFSLVGCASKNMTGKDVVVILVKTAVSVAVGPGDKKSGLEVASETISGETREAGLVRLAGDLTGGLYDLIVPEALISEMFSGDEEEENLISPETPISEMLSDDEEEEMVFEVAEEVVVPGDLFDAAAGQWWESGLVHASIVSRERVEVLTEPRFGSDILASADLTGKLVIRELSGGWARVNTEGGETGWVALHRVELGALDAGPSNPLR